MNIYEQMKLWRQERDEMERVCNETKENCCMRYSKKNDKGRFLVDGGCEKCPLFYETEEYVGPGRHGGRYGLPNISGMEIKYRCKANLPLKEFYDFITKEEE